MTASKQMETEQSKNYFRIADLLVLVVLPASCDVLAALPTFAPFRTDAEPNERPIVRLVVTFDKAAPHHEKLQILTEESLVWGDNFRFSESPTAYVTNLATSEQHDEWTMRSSKDFADNTVYALREEIESTSVLGWLIMVAFAQAAVAYKTLLIHASVVERDGRGVAFLGKSGTGKSTHSRLWLTHHSGFRLLNDDNPAVRIHDDGTVYIYGTPWSGKTACYRSLGVALSAVVRLSQAKENEFTHLDGKEALIALLPSGSALRWNKSLFASMTAILQDMVSKVNIGHLACLPDKEAAKLCYLNTIEKYS